MVVTKYYRYIGENGIMITPIRIPGATYVEVLRLQADKGKLITDGTIQILCQDIDPADLDKWSEVEVEDDGL